MLEVLKGNFDEDENGIELRLSLSIGGNYRKKNDQICNSDDKMLIQWQRSKKRELHREMMENEELICRKSKIGTLCNEGVKSLNLSLKQDSYINDVPFRARNAGKNELMKKKYRGFRVSARGNGPNGKTINGLLLKYDNKLEINIVCVCHGKSFIPCQFVEHAGGVDVSHPLRHITLIPPVFNGESN